MKYKLKRIGVLKAAIMGAIFYGIISLLLVPFFLFFAMVAPMAGDMGAMPGDFMMSGAFALLLPIMYAVMGFIGSALGAAVYNLIATMMGGLEIELERVGADPAVAAPPSIGY